MLQTADLQVAGLAGRGDLAAYLLGLGEYAYRDAYRDAEGYHRLHQVIQALARGATDDREMLILRYGAQLNHVDRVLAALLVEGARERLSATSPGWAHIAEATYFRIAVEHGCLMDYVGFWGHFAVPAYSDQADRHERYRIFIDHYLSLPEGPGRHGLRLALLKLFEGVEEQVAVGLALANRLHGRDPLLDALAARRALLALERGEVLRYDAAYRDLAVQMVAAIGRWRVAGALPHLRRLLEATPARDRDARVLRAHLQRAIEQILVR